MTNAQEYKAMLQEEQEDIKQDITTALEKCKEYGIDPKQEERLIRFTPNGFRYFTDVSYADMTTHELANLCDDVENELEALQKYLNGLQALCNKTAQLEKLDA